MYIVRSAFWLSLAFVLMAPTAGMDVGQAARSAGNELAAQGARAVASGLAPENCGSIECAVGRTLIVSALPEPAAPATPPAPVPPPRPLWAY